MSRQEEKEKTRMLKSGVQVQVYNSKTRQVYVQSLKRSNLLKRKVIFTDTEEHTCVGIIVGFGENGSFAVSQADGKIPKDGTGIMVVV